MDDGGAAHVEKWLRESGLPLEARVLAAFRAAGADAEHARRYPDPESRKIREVDVVARLCNVWSSTLLTAVVECKSSRNVTWVALVDDELRRNYMRDNALLPAVRVVERGGATRADLVRVWDVPVLRADVTLAYQLVDTGSRAETWDALQQVLDAVDGVVRDVPNGADGRALTVIIPVLVTASPLYTCRVTREGELDVRPADDVVLVARLRSGDERQAVWVVHERGLAGFVARLRDSADGLRTSP